MPALEEHLVEDEDLPEGEALLNTIKVPRNLRHLTERLPKSNYINASQPPGKRTLPQVPGQLSNMNASRPEDPQSILGMSESSEPQEVSTAHGGGGAGLGKKKRTVPKTTPSSRNGIQNLYAKYALE